MKIAIVKLSALGDIIHAMVVLQFIKQHLPNSTIDWVVEEGFKDILANNPDINTIHTVNIKKAKKNKSLKYMKWRNFVLLICHVISCVGKAYNLTLWKENLNNVKQNEQSPLQSNHWRSPHVMLEIQVVAWDIYKNGAELNR